jgi:hypothetical protein
MLGRRERRRPELFVAGSLRGLVPDGHILARVGRVLGLGWLRSEVEPLYRAAAGRPGIDPEVEPLYRAAAGRPGIDPEVAVRLMPAGPLLGIVRDRRRMREAQVNLAIRWSIGSGLHEAPPDHSSLTRIRQRRGGAPSGSAPSWPARRSPASRRASPRARWCTSTPRRCGPT